MEEKRKGFQADFRPIAMRVSDDIQGDLKKEYFLDKLKHPRKEVVDMSGRVLKLLLTAYKVWNLHYRHEPKAVHFYWKHGRFGNQYHGSERVADIIFFDARNERKYFFVEIVSLFHTAEISSQEMMRIRWCTLWKDEDGIGGWKDRDATREERHNHESLLGETYIRI